MNYVKQKLEADSREFFVYGASWAFGFWLFYIGLNKWIGPGPAGFVGYIAGQFAETWSPAVLNKLLASIILVAEPVVGLWLMSGWKRRLAWIAAAKLMFLLLFGQTMLGNHDKVASLWHYFVFTLACAALSEPQKAAE